MRIIICLTVLLCMRLSVSPAHAQGNSDLKGTACVPVRTLAEDKLAFQAGEKLDFVLHYRWGAINSDVGYATVRLDDVRFNGKDAFLCSVYGQTTKFFDFFFRLSNQANRAYSHTCPVLLQGPRGLQELVHPRRSGAAEVHP